MNVGNSVLLWEISTGREFRRVTLSPIVLVTTLAPPQELDGYRLLRSRAYFDESMRTEKSRSVEQRELVPEGLNCLSRRNF